MITEYKCSIKFSDVGRTIIYEDNYGKLLFSFDVHPSKDKSKGEWTMELGNKPYFEDNERAQNDFENKRIQKAILKTKEFISDRGYQISS